MTEIVSSPLLGPLEREARRLGDGQDLDLQAVGVLRRRGTRSTFLRISASCARRLVEPEHGGRAGRAGALDREPHPVGDRARPWSGSRARCRRARRRARAASSPAPSTTRTRAGRRDLERLVVAAVLLGLLRHQADVRRRAHRRRVERAVLAAEVDRLRVQRGVAGVGDHGLGVLLVAVGVPHLARGADHRRHRGVDDHVARDVQVGDPAVGVDHREVRRAARRSPRSPASIASRSSAGRSLERAQDAGQAVVRVGAGLASASPCSANTSAKNARTAWPKMIGSETFIIVAFRCSEKRTPCSLASAICSARNASSARAAHHRAVDDLARERPGRRP